MNNAMLQFIGYVLACWKDTLSRVEAIALACWKATLSSGSCHCSIEFFPQVWVWLSLGLRWFRSCTGPPTPACWEAPPAPPPLACWGAPRLRPLPKMLGRAGPWESPACACFYILLIANHWCSLYLRRSSFWILDGWFIWHSAQSLWSISTFLFWFLGNTAI